MEHDGERKGFLDSVKNALGIGDDHHDGERYEEEDEGPKAFIVGGDEPARRDDIAVDHEAAVGVGSTRGRTGYGDDPSLREEDERELGRNDPLS